MQDWKKWYRTIKVQQKPHNNRRKHNKKEKQKITKRTQHDETETQHVDEGKSQ